MTEETKFKLFIFEELDFNKLSAEQTQIIIDKIVKGSKDKIWWSDDTKLKYSLIKCEYLPGDYIYGWITQQHLLEQHLYDESKEESNNLLNSFEDRFFVLNLRDNLLAIEWRNFTLKKPLTNGLMINRISNIFSEICRTMELLKHVRVVPLPTLTTDKKQFLEIFYQHKIIGVTVEGFGTDIVPKDAVLVNPTPNLEGAMRELIWHDTIHPSISKLIAESRKDMEADLKRSAIVRAAVHSGQPVRMEYENQNKQIKVRKKTEKGEIVIDLPVYQSDTPESRVQMALAVVNAVEGRDISYQRIEAFKNNQQITLLDLEGNDE